MKPIEQEIYETLTDRGQRIFGRIREREIGKGHWDQWQELYAMMAAQCLDLYLYHHANLGPRSEAVNEWRMVARQYLSDFRMVKEAHLGTLDEDGVDADVAAIANG